MNFNSFFYTYLHYFFIIMYNPANAAILNKPFIHSYMTFNVNDLEQSLSLNSDTNSSHVLSFIVDCIIGNICCVSKIPTSRVIN